MVRYGIKGLAPIPTPELIEAKKILMEAFIDFVKSSGYKWGNSDEFLYFMRSIEEPMEYNKEENK